ncbi:IclR family transcriptional regulator [Agrococcus sp. SGAir0287]|uniref:IclR family transcriptional regulator n=1 Tax=Agrococcus sp. SGAir0287 TaxID=2070347 RepID=UPI0010CD1BA1|nr:helix-turn-helix domain-containing protein [Agrococcus sp. SGAir0287]QCR18795.1 ArsR family transcriptional regulator [Agrococcus sp. SGAir0287]
MAEQLAGAQTLSRGLRALEILAERSPLTIQQLSEELGVHRSIAYRIVRTLEAHRLVVRDAGGRLELGAQLAVLAQSVDRDLRGAALPHLTALAQATGCTAFVAVQDGDDVVTLVSVESRGARASVAQRPGTRHPLALGAPGIALQTMLSQPEWAALGHDDAMRAEVALAAERGFATSSDEVVPGLSGVAAPIRHPLPPRAAVGVVTVGAADLDALGAASAEAARAIAADLG